VPAAKQKPSVKTTSTNTLILIYGVLAVVAISVTVLAGRSLINSLLLNNRVISKKEAANVQSEANIEAVRQLSESYQTMGSVQQAAEKALPVTSNFPDIVNVMQGIATSSAVKLGSVNPEGSSKSATSLTTTTTTTTSASGGAAEPYEFGAQVTGTLPNIVTFLKNIELSARPMYVVGVSYTGTTPALQATVQIRTFHTTPAVYVDKTEVIK
jgi:Tfp pilus assembly protein PilO